MMTLFGFGRTFGLCDGSPFVIKTHAYLRMAKFDYTRKNGTQNLRHAPKKKLPYRWCCLGCYAAKSKSV